MCQEMGPWPQPTEPGGLGTCGPRKVEKDSEKELLLFSQTASLQSYSEKKEASDLQMEETIGNDTLSSTQYNLP